MTLVVSISQDDLMIKLRELVLFVVPPAVEVVQGLGNRVPMPPAQFVAMTASRMTPHRTPQETYDRDALPAPDALQIEQGTIVRVQLDCYSPDAGNWAVGLVALFRSSKGVELLGPDVAPLFCDNPIQAALVGGEKQYVDRWIVGANLQYNPVVSVPQEFATAASADLINVDVRFPP